MKNIAAYLRLRRTMLTTHTAHLVGRYLRDTGARQLPAKPVSDILLRVLVCRALRKAGLISETGDGQGASEFLPREEQAVEEWSSGFYREYMKPKLSGVVLDIIAYHRKKGHVLVIVSGQVRTVLKHAALDLGFDHVICTDLAVDRHGFFTGRAAGTICVDSHKTDLARALAAERGIDLESSYSYGNNEADESILSMAGNPVAVEPTRRLEAIAQERGWRIVGH